MPAPGLACLFEVIDSGNGIRELPLFSSPPTLLPFCGRLGEALSVSCPVLPPFSPKFVVVGSSRPINCG